VPQSANALNPEAVHVTLDPEILALLGRMVAQIKEYQERARRAEASVRAMRTGRKNLTALEQQLEKAEALVSTLAAQMSGGKKDHHQIEAELHEELQRERAAHAGARAHVHELKARLAAAAKESEERAEEISRLGARQTHFEERMTELAVRSGKLEEYAHALRRDRDEARHLLESHRIAEPGSETIVVRLQEKEAAIQRLSEELRLALEKKGEAESMVRQRLDDIEHLSAELSGVTQSAEAEILEIQAELRAEREAHLLAERALVAAQEELRSLRLRLDALYEGGSAPQSPKAGAARVVETSETAGERQASADAREEELHNARERIRALETELERMRKRHHSAPDISDDPTELIEEEPQPPRAEMSGKDGPFAGPFLAPSSQKSTVQGIALIPEVMDEDFDDQEMLDTLMRFLQSEE
jgi:DNA repair exonuclease SbcCD ATPase subunit